MHMHVLYKKAGGESWRGKSAAWWDTVFTAPVTHGDLLRLQLETRGQGFTRVLCYPSNWTLPCVPGVEGCRSVFLFALL